MDPCCDGGRTHPDVPVLVSRRIRRGARYHRRGVGRWRCGRGIRRSRVPLGVATNRPLRIGAFDVRGTTVAATDEVIPVAVEVSAASGEVTRVHTWHLAATHRGRPTATDIALSDEEILVASPAAGGLVRIDRVSSAVTVVPLDEDPGSIAVGREAVWIWADAEYQPSAGTEAQRRPVIWEEPTEEEVEQRRAQMTGWFAYVPGAPPEERVPAAEGARLTAAEWRDTEDDLQDVVPPPTPLWRITGEQVSTVPVGGELIELAAAGDLVVIVCQLPSDPLIKRVEPFGSLHYIRPGTVLAGDGSGSWQAVGSVEDTSCGVGSIAVDEGRIWLIGFSREADERSSEVREVDVAARRLHDGLPLQLENPVTVAHGHVVDLIWGGDDGYEDDGDDEQPRRAGRAVRLVATDGGNSRVVGGPLVDDEPVTDGSTVWFRSALDEAALVAVDVARATARQVTIEFDCRPHAPEAQPPEGLDLVAFEAQALERLRSSLFGGWHDARGERHPFIEGVTFESAELRGEFPETEIVATFHADERPGVRFGRRWPLYDDLGNQLFLGGADIELMEDIEAAGYGLPPSSRCVPDAEGVVWF